MKRAKSANVAMYGNTKLLRVYCYACRCNAFVVKGFKACCDTEIKSELRLENFTIECEPEFIRKTPPKEIQEKILNAQDHSCFYCEHTFNTHVFRDGKPKRVVLNWDHFVPWAYSRDNKGFNFVAACSICNQLKSNKVFDTVDQARLYIYEKRRDKGYL